MPEFLPTLVYDAGKVPLLSSENCESSLKKPKIIGRNPKKDESMSNPNGYSRNRAWNLLNEHTQSPSLLKHALAVETCVRAYGEREADAQRLIGEVRDTFIEQYSITGLLHDFDYEKYP